MTIPEAFELALQHHGARRLAEAEAIYRQILAVDSGHADALHQLGLVARQSGRSADAVAMLRQAIALRPDHPIFHYNLGNALRDDGQIENAISAFRRALELRPMFPEARATLGHALAAQGRLDEAITEFHLSLRDQPHRPEVHCSLGNALRDRGHLDAAVTAYHRAVELLPAYPEAFNNLGNVLADLGRPEEAIEAYRQALQFKPDYVEAHSNLGVALNEKGLLTEAVAEYQAALRLQPQLPGVLCNLGSALRSQGKLDQALTAYRHALALQPSNVQARNNLLLTLHYPDDVNPESTFAEHRQWEEVLARPVADFLAPPANDRNPERCLRVGYVSPDFRAHSVAFFFENLLRHHDREQVEVFCYSNVRRADAVTARLRTQAAHWREITGMSDAQVANLIRADGIDILVDLAGHTAGNRLLVFARRPAPVQVSYLGYCDTTGLSAIDYRFTDAHADPPGMTEHLHTEQLIRLAGSAWCFRPSEEAPPVDALPAQTNSWVTFGSFNTMPKITDRMLALWAEILRVAPHSRLLIKNLALKDRAVQERVRSVLKTNGVDPSRLELLARMSTTAEHLRCYGRVDIALDTFPYHGTTTTCEALWMGVPVITLTGKTHASRVGVSLLSNAGLAEFIAHATKNYVRLAVQLSADLPRLADIRSSLRGQMAASPLLNAPYLARSVELAYREMWRTWCARGILHT